MKSSSAGAFDMIGGVGEINDQEVLRRERMEEE
jgi:hypothetical protein